jgi:hypothetical protein
MPTENQLDFALEQQVDTSSSILLTCDLHLTDSLVEAYRWDVFKFIKEACKKYNVNHIFILGDTTDRVDRHSGELLNKFARALSNLHDETGAQIWITQGNHDRQIKGTPYWEILNKLGTAVQYITEPINFGYQNVLILPFSTNPLEEWKNFDLATYNAILMHQTVAGSLVEGDYKLEVDSNPMPSLSDKVVAYSGDVHRPQTVGRITYIGAPHPVKYSESWPNRFIIIKDSKWKEPISEWIRPVHRDIYDLDRDCDDRVLLGLQKGDQIRIRYHLTAKDLTEWPVKEEYWKKWCSKKGIYLASLEAILSDDITTDTDTKEEKASTLELLNPEEALKLYASEEKLSEDVINVGLELMKEARK